MSDMFQRLRRAALPPVLRLRRRSLRTWLLAGALTLAIGVAGAMSLASIWESRASARILGRAEVRGAWERSQARVSQLLHAAEMTAGSAARAMGAEARPASEWIEIFNRLVPAFEQRPELTYLGYADARTGEAIFLRRRLDAVLECIVYIDRSEGERVIRTYRRRQGELTLFSEQPWDGYDPRSRPYFDLAAKAARPVWTASYPFMDPDGLPPILGITHAVPVPGVEGELLGVWDADFDTRALCEFMQQIRQETGALAFVVEALADGREMLVAHPEPARIDKVALERRPAEAWMRSEVERVFPAHLETWLGESGSLVAPHPPWTVIALLPESGTAAAFAASRSLLRVLVAAGAIFIAVAGSMVFARRMARPVEALRGAVAGVAAGDHPTLRPSDAPRELIDLQHAFVEMTRAIDERQAAIESSNANLRSEVRQRAEREALNDALFANLPFELWVVDPLGICLRQNPASRTRLGDLDGRRLAEVAPEFARALGWEEQFARAVAGEVVTRDVASNEGAGVRYSQSVLAPVRIDGSVTGIVCVNIDVTERRRAEEALRSSQRRLNLHLENTPMGVIDWTPKFTVAAWNPAAEMIFGWSAPEALGRHASFIIPEDERAGVDESWQDMLQRRTSARYSNQNVTRDGRAIECEWYSTVVTDNHGEIAGVSSLVLDVTERVRAERAFRESEDRFRLAFRRAPVPQAIIRRVDRAVIDVNDHWESVFGLSRQEIVGRTALQLGIWPEPEERANLLKELEASGEVRDSEVRLRRAGGQMGVFLVSITLVDLAADACMLVTQIDITARKKAEEGLQALNETLEQRVAVRTSQLAEANTRLQEVDRLKSEFLATMSHELRTPLNSIVGFSSILREGMAGELNPEQQKQIGMVHNSARHLVVLISDLLDLSRIEAGRMELAHETVNLGEVLREVEATLSPMSKARRIAFATVVAPDLPAVISDHKRLFQIFLNLAGNAVKFTERGGIDIAARPTEDGVRIEVRDTGMGIRPEHLPRLFQPFRQVDGSARRVHEGTGLGLYLVRKLLDLLGGHIEVSSEFGVGSVFTVFLPLAAPVPAEHVDRKELTT